ncbi:MAG: minor capsid protein [Methanimicrococcus sp.]|nr:minor capsid protein [Methanimicrococcus sp.]
MKTNRSASYWKRRLEAQQRAQMRRGVRLYNEMNQEYLKAAANVEKEIRAWYARYATAEGMTLADARRFLTSPELNAFKANVGDYLKLGQKGNNKNWVKQLESMTARSNISRLEALQTQMLHQAEVLYAKQLHELADLSKGIYASGYYGTAYEVQKGAGIGWPIQKLNEKKIERVMSKPWTADGLTFSDRVWKQQEELCHTLKTEMAQMLMRGEAPDRAIRNIAHKFETSKTQAGRLIMTESAHFASEAQKDSFSDLGVQEFQFIATLDETACKTCGRLDGKHAKMSEFKVGQTAPPLHPNCRCTTVPYFDDMADWGAERIARRPDGTTYSVPADMTYEEWRETFVTKTTHGIVKPAGMSDSDYGQKITEIHKNGSLKEIAEKLLKEQNINLPVEMVHLIGANGQCGIEWKDIGGGKEIVVINSYEIDYPTTRKQEYVEKTIDHEAFHASANGLQSDKNKIGRYEWGNIEETMAETSAVFLSSLRGNTLHPAYPKILVYNLPKLKTLFPEFKNCKTIADFGEVSSKFRFGTNRTAKWEKYISIYTQKLDLLEYSKQYVTYITDNKENLLNRVLDSLPIDNYEKAYYLSKLDQILDNINKGIPITNPMTEEMLNDDWNFFHDILIGAMDINGIEGI